VVQERDANNLPLVTYTRGNDLSGTRQGAGGIGGLLARTANSQLLTSDSFASALYHADGNGNVTCLIYTNQMIAAKYLYDPYGNMLSMYGSLADANSYRFSSKEWNQNSGLYYYLYRLYDANMQRWLNRDPSDDWGSLVNYLQNIRESDIDNNLYRSVANAPVNFIDRYGLWRSGGKRDPTINTIVCDGKGGVRPSLSDKEEKCGCGPGKKCAVEHEKSHIEDVLAENPDICKGKKDGVQVYTYSTKQLNASERKAYDKEIECVKENAADFTKECSTSAEDYIKELQEKRKEYE
jgi:RHS repeat-associated protein